MIDSGIAVASLISATMSIIASITMLEYYNELKRDFNRKSEAISAINWSMALVSYGIGHFIVSLMFFNVIELSIINNFIYFNISGALSMSLFLSGTIRHFSKDKKMIKILPAIFGIIFFVGVTLYGFVIPTDSIFTIINLSGEYTEINNMSWYIIEILIPVSFINAYLIYKLFVKTNNNGYFYIFIHFFLYALLLVVWPFRELKLFFYIGRTLATGSILVGCRAVARQKKWERLLEQSHEELNFFLDLLSHDIKNIIMNVKLLVQYSEEIKKGSSIGKEIEEQEITQRITTNLDRITELIYEVEKYRKFQLTLGKSSFKKYDLKKVIETILADINNNYPDKKINHTLNTDDKAAYPIVGNEFITDLFNNLINNAIKHNDKKTIIIDITITSTTKYGKQYWKVVLGDNGPGLSSEVQKRIFSKALRRGQVSGIGLTLVKKLVDFYGGEISAENKIVNDKVVGARFTVLLPKFRKKVDYSTIFNYPFYI